MTDQKINDLWINRSCFAAIEAGDILAQVRHVVRMAPHTQPTSAAQPAAQPALRPEQVSTLLDVALWELQKVNKTLSALQATPPPVAGDAKTGWPPGLLQDDDKGLSKWLSKTPNAKQEARDAALPHVAGDAELLDWMEDRTHDSGHSIQIRLVRDFAINSGINRIELRIGCGSGMYERAFEGNSLRAAIAAAIAAGGSKE